MATMKDVARRAGVSTATVSRVINNTAYVEPVTRERVEKAMREFNYHRNAAALALAKRSGNMLGLLTGNLDDPFFHARAGRGRHHAAGRRAVDVVQRRASGRAGKSASIFSSTVDAKPSWRTSRAWGGGAAALRRPHACAGADQSLSARHRQPLHLARQRQCGADGDRVAHTPWASENCLRDGGSADRRPRAAVSGLP